MAPKEVHEIVEQIRTPHDEEILDLVRETLAQLNKLGDRLESYIGERHPKTIASEHQSATQVTEEP